MGLLHVAGFFFRGHRVSLGSLFPGTFFEDSGFVPAENGIADTEQLTAITST